MRLNKQRTLCIIPELTILTTPLYFLPHNSTQWCSAKLHGRRGMVYPMFTPGQFTMAPLRRLVSNGQTLPANERAKEGEGTGRKVWRLYTGCCFTMFNRLLLRNDACNLYKEERCMNCLREVPKNTKQEMKRQNTSRFSWSRESTFFCWISCDILVIWLPQSDRLRRDAGRDYNILFRRHQTSWDSSLEHSNCWSQHPPMILGSWSLVSWRD